MRIGMSGAPYVLRGGDTMTGDLTMAGANIDLGANRLLTTNCSLRDGGVTYMAMRNRANTLDAALSGTYITMSADFFLNTTVAQVGYDLVAAVLALG